MTSKDKKITYEELADLCRKQEEYIKELENKIDDMKRREIEECREPLKETYEMVARYRDKLREQLTDKEKIISALEKSLAKLNDEAMSYEQEAEWYRKIILELREQVNSKG